mmetsp:Transcript_118465/g.334996  ORF Transcript_118465/g.334996 Transcript_118465/m.334996 type:complete len:263 (+) Transcript_118465:95-883(+)
MRPPLKPMRRLAKRGRRGPALAGLAAWKASAPATALPSTGGARSRKPLSVKRPSASGTSVYVKLLGRFKPPAMKAKCSSVRAVPERLTPPRWKVWAFIITASPVRSGAIKRAGLKAIRDAAAATWAGSATGTCCLGPRRSVQRRCDRPGGRVARRTAAWKAAPCVPGSTSVGPISSQTSCRATKMCRIWAAPSSSPARSTSACQGWAAAPGREVTAPNSTSGSSRPRRASPRPSAAEMSRPCLRATRRKARWAASVIGKATS